MDKSTNFPEGQGAESTLLLNCHRQNGTRYSVLIEFRKYAFFYSSIVSDVKTRKILFVYIFS